MGVGEQIWVLVRTMGVLWLSNRMLFESAVTCLILRAQINDGFIPPYLSK